MIGDVGVLLDDRLSLRELTEKICNSSRAVLSLIKRKAKEFDDPYVTKTGHLVSAFRENVSKEAGNGPLCDKGRLWTKCNRSKSNFLSAILDGLLTDCLPTNLDSSFFF